MVYRAIKVLHDWQTAHTPIMSCLHVRIMHDIDIVHAWYLGKEIILMCWCVTTSFRIILDLHGILYNTDRTCI